LLENCHDLMMVTQAGIMEELIEDTFESMEDDELRARLAKLTN